MKRIEVAAGQVFGDLTTIKEAKSDGKRRKFLCKCQCGAKVEVRLDHLRGGHTSSCGGCGIEYQGKRMTLTDWAKAYGINESTLRMRLRTMSMREALGRGKR